MKINKYIFTFLLLGLTCLNCIAEGVSGHFSIDFTNKNVKFSSTYNFLYEWLDIDRNTTFEITRDEIDELNIRHTTYQQYYNGLKVDGNIVLVHSKNNIIKSVNGVIMGKEDSIENDIPSSILKSAKHNNLKIIPISKNGTTIYKKAIEIEENNKRIFIDESTNDTLKILSQIYNVEGKGYTMYNGWQDISCTYGENNNYTLIDYDRSIYTLYAGNTTQMIEEATQFRDNCEHYQSPSSTFSGILTSITITKVSGNWWGNSLIDSDPDLYIKVKDSKGKLLYKTVVKEDTKFPVTWDLENHIIHIDELSTIEIYDEDYDSDDEGGSISLTKTEPGTYYWSNSKTSGYFTIKANPAVDAHWGMQKVLDFYSIKLNRNGYNNKGTRIFQFINPVGQCGENYNNAYATLDPNGIGYMVYGMGDGIQMNPVVSLDVMAHEFTHMVTNFNGNGGLNYVGESGALNESFSDILGTAVEFYGLGSKANWQIGEDVMVTYSDLRKMNAPKKSKAESKEKSIQAFLNVLGLDNASELPTEIIELINNIDENIGLSPQPDTYQGEYWIDTEDLENDHGGVHSNSGVQNYWFYLLAEGGIGTNDNNESYNIKGIGIENATKIAYRNLTFYLTPDATFEDAVDGSMKAAKDLYEDSPSILKTVYECWRAVGLHLDKYDKIYNSNAIDDAINDELEIYSHEGFLYIKSSCSAPLIIVSTSGTLLYHTKISPDQETHINMSKENIVIVKVGDITRKVLIQKS